MSREQFSKDEKRAQRFFEQRLEHGKAKGKSGISLGELQVGFIGFKKAMEKKEAKQAGKNVQAS